MEQGQLYLTEGHIFNFLKTKIEREKAREREGGERERTG